MALLLPGRPMNEQGRMVVRIPPDLEARGVSMEFSR